MPFTAQVNKDFFIKNDEIVLSDEYIQKNKWKFKKITGSRVASILNCNEYVTDVKTWCMMVGIYREEMDQTLAEAGNIIEPKIREYVEKRFGVKYLCYDPSKIGWDVFKDNDIFGGIPDGEPINEKGEIDYNSKKMLEIKTTSIDSFQYVKEKGGLMLKKDKNGMPIVKKKNGKLEKWFDSNDNIVIPKEYQLQLALYLYLRKVKTGMFAIAFLKKEDYAYPSDFNIDSTLIKTVDFRINLDEFEKVIKILKSWYENYIEKGISPKIKQKDINWIKEELNNEI